MAKVSLTKPEPSQIRAAREMAGLTQTQAAQSIHSTCRTWQQWEAGDRGMHLAFWELFQIKVAEIAISKASPNSFEHQE